MKNIVLEKDVGNIINKDILENGLECLKKHTFNKDIKYMIDYIDKDIIAFTRNKLKLDKMYKCTDKRFFLFERNKTQVIDIETYILNKYLYIRIIVDLTEVNRSKWEEKDYKYRKIM